MQTLCDADIINNCLVTQFLCPQELIKETRKQNNYFSIDLHYFVTATLMASFYVFTFTLSHRRLDWKPACHKKNCLKWRQIEQVQDTTGPSSWQDACHPHKPVGLFITQLVRSSALFKECYGSNLDWNLVSLSKARDTLRQIPPQEYSDNSPAILLKSNYCSEKKKKKWKKIATNWLWCSCFVLRFHCASRELCYAYTLCLIQLLHTWG